jgi:TolB-like protein
VVLPFTNLSDDPEQKYFADGITKDLTTDLSRIGGSFVIARNTAFTYEGKPVDAKQIGRELGVRYLLEGSVRRSGQQVRVNAQLIDTESGAHLWAERLDRDMGNLFRLQNEITGQIARALQFELAVADAARLTRTSRRAGLHPAGTGGVVEVVDLQRNCRRGCESVRARIGARPSGGRGANRIGAHAGKPRA